MFQENLDDFLADFGVSITAGAISGLGILDVNADVILDRQVHNFQYALTCRADLFGGLQYMAAVNVNGVAFQVKREPTPIDDGAFVIAELQRVTVLQPTVKTVIDLDGGTTPGGYTSSNVPQLIADYDGGTVSADILDGNDLDGGTA
jgi:hypothetical protein